MRAEFFIAILPIAIAFNFDVKYPIIIHNRADGQDSLFGASLNLLRDESSGFSWVVIGSPRANSTSKILENVAEPGQVWRCSIGRNPETCEVVEVDPENINGNGLVDRKNESWLGGSIFSRGEKFVACASRWSNQYAHSKDDSYHYFMNGQCYWRPKADLTQNTVPAVPPKNYRLHPLRDKDWQSIEKDKFYWVFGQAGFSSHISDLGDLILGAPGIDQWKGGFIRYFDATSGGTGESQFFQNHYISRPEVDKFDEGESNFFGYAVSSGSFFKTRNSDKNIQFVGGGPRGNSLDGRVVIFTFPNNEAGIIANPKLQILQTIDGEQIGSYFGSVLCTVDVNNDGFDDLLIGAPNYNTKLRLRLPPGVSAQVSADPTQESDTSSGIFQGNGDEGSVFLYLSSGSFLRRTVSLVGGNKAWSHFGSSIISLGDINKDGFNDVAIGSPYEDGERGAVYIFHGMTDGLETDYAQVIKASIIDTGLRGFGYSLASEVDIDRNGYNEISIGAFASNQVVILRARPVVRISAKIKTKLQKLPLDTSEFEFESCLSYTGFSAPASLSLGITIKTDAESIVPRVHIKVNAASSNTSVTYFVKAQRNNTLCTKFNAIVKTNLTITTKPIVFEQNAFLSDEADQPGPQSRVYTVTRFGSSYNTQVRGPELNSFCQSCPVRVKSKPFITKLALEVPCRSIDHCTSEFALKASFVGVTKGGSFVIGSAPSVTLQVTVQNLREPAFSPTISISWRKRHLVRIPPNCQKHNSEDINLMSYQCSLGQMLPTNGIGTVEFEIDMRGIYAGLPDMESEYLFDIHANTTSELVAPANLAMILLLRAEADVWLSGSKLEVKYNPAEDVMLPRKLASFQVFLDGYTAVGKMLLYFEIPVNITSNSKKMPLIQITNYKATMDRTSLQCKSDDNSLPSTEKAVIFDPSLDAEMIEPNLVQHSDRGNLRRKRDTEDWLSHKIVINYSNRKKPDISTNRKVLSLDCSRSTVDCVRLHCIAENFNVGSNAVIEFGVTTNAQTMKHLMKSHKTESVHIHSYGTARIVGIDSQYIQPLEHKPDEVYAVTVVKPQVTEIPTWVYTVSVVGGLLVLGGLILCLYALGFFDRKKKDEVEDMHETNDEKEFDEEREDYDEVDALQPQSTDADVNAEGYDDDNEMDDRAHSPLETEQVTENISFSRR